MVLFGKRLSKQESRTISIIPTGERDANFEVEMRKGIFVVYFLRFRHHVRLNIEHDLIFFTIKSVDTWGGGGVQG